MSNPHMEMVQDTAQEYSQAFTKTAINLKRLCIAIYKWNKFNGFWDEPRSVQQVLELARSEKFEAFEDIRKSPFTVEETSLAGKIDFLNLEYLQANRDEFSKVFKSSRQSEVADIGVRLCDYFGYLIVEHNWEIFAEVLPITIWKTYLDDTSKIDFTAEQLYQIEKNIMNVELEYDPYIDPYGFTHLRLLKHGTHLVSLGMTLSLIFVALYVNFKETNFESFRAKLLYNLTRPYKHGKNF